MQSCLVLMLILMGFGEWEVEGNVYSAGKGGYLWGCSASAERGKGAFPVLEPGRAGIAPTSYLPPTVNMSTSNE